MDKELKLTKRIYILGRIHEAHLNYLLEKARVLILPSQFEIMPTVILEAWAAGCPVIVNNYYGVQALIRHQQTGLLFQNQNSAQLASSVQELIKNRNLTQNLIQSAKTQVETKYHSSRVAVKILRLYKTLLKR